MKVIDLFSGIGGLSEGFRESGFDVVVANEIDEEIAKSYKKNNPDTVMINEDITKMDISSVFKEYKNCDVVLGGPPCQGFSQKGKRLSLKDPRNYLFRYFAKVVKFIRPQFFVMENVSNLLTTSSGFFKKEIDDVFSNMGYLVNMSVLNVSDYGVPQNRRRAIIIGTLGDIKVKFPAKNEVKINTWDAISDLAFLNSGEGEFRQEYRFPAKTDYEKMLRENSNYLYNHISTRHSEKAINRMKLIPENGDRSNLPKEELTRSIYSGTWGRVIKDQQSVTITTRFDTPSSGRFTHPSLNRALTVREAARIQSFPDTVVFYGTKSSQMKQVGNAVPPLLAKKIANQILRHKGDK
ncbi:DNA cytosine methyltransferase [Levilactobacillus brevis]|uniref:DNA cytosine methyltransferase n=1 Tax=Levilactobacillus brevis TaxID=1580 RepID=UPI000B3E92E5|nr:DNA cytosine methyltransferase [Levilactobacillus brevis]ARW51211.1 DNA (cytosine-5-)-methyltransferase [Levilactobacillus brevis]MCS8597527.1 DNA cytosine methyltransferase [Levilactobacillus brevis]MCT3564248.1 DNA cytosine methyltransferase [Levilactobacillus brevis]NRD28858.1 DNA cytosine methyltransferase [Levilactobacillus brevis]QCZ51247.1 DNA-cytosine methyltransferase [Levilactobacillus brevis]